MLKTSARTGFRTRVLVLALGAGSVPAMVEEDTWRFALPVYAWVPNYDFGDGFALKTATPSGPLAGARFRF